MSAAVTEDASAVEAVGPAWEAVEDGVKFRIPLDQGAEGVKWFALSEPNRLVVDVLNASTPLIKSLTKSIIHGSTVFGLGVMRARPVSSSISTRVVFNGDPALTASGDWVTMTFELCKSVITVALFSILVPIFSNPKV